MYYIIEERKMKGVEFLYYVRIVFFCKENLVFNNITTEQPIILFENNTHRCMAKLKRQGNKDKVIIEYGAFDFKELAENEGINLLRNIKLVMCKESNPINISGIMGMLDCTVPRVMPARFTEDGLEYIKQQLVASGRITKDVKVLEDVLGMSIYKVNTSMNEIHFVAQDAEIKYNTDLKLEWKNFKSWSEELDIVTSLLNTSILINDVRMRFLLKIMAIEVLVSEKEYKNNDYILFINNFIENFQFENIPNDLESSLKNDIGNLKLKSIGQKCNALVAKYCKDNLYDGIEAVKLFKECYKIRSKFVHAGEIDLQKLELYDHCLKKLVIDVIEKMSGIERKE